MRSKVTLTKAEARRVLLIHQGLWPPRSLSGAAGVMKHLRRVRSVQFDPLNIVGHNQELVLQARVGDFRPEMLDGLLYRKRKLLDGWDKQMSIYPVEDRPYFGRQRDAGRNGIADPPEVLRTIEEARKAIRERGPLSSIDLEHDEKVSWAWGPTRLAKAALESMFFSGELVIHHRVHTRRIYDFASNHIAADILAAPDPNIREEDYRDWHVLRRLRGVGLLWARSSEAWLEIRGVKTGERAETFRRLCERNLVTKIEVEGVREPLYMAEADRSLMARARKSQAAPAACIIAPLDNLLWDRGLIRTLFDFDYVWEVYKPVSEREYGYYVLPVLHGDRFVARFEPGKDRESGSLEIKQWWWEPGVKPTKAMKSAIAECFREFIRYLDAPAIRIGRKASQRAGISWIY